MITQVNFSGFCDAFRAMDRSENFSYEGKRALYDYLEEYGESTGEPVELDVIALCCEYSEDTIESVLENYDLKNIEELEDHTTVIRLAADSVLYQSY